MKEQDPRTLHVYLHELSLGKLNVSLTVSLTSSMRPRTSPGVKNVWSVPLLAEG